MSDARTKGKAEAGRAEAVPTASLTAGDLMSDNPLTITADQHVLLAWELLVTAGVHHLPVIDADRCIAVLDDRMLAREWVVGPLASAQRTVRSLCRHSTPSVTSDTPIRRVAEIMHVAVTDAVTVLDGHRLIGLITVRDLVAALAGARRPRGVDAHIAERTFGTAPAPPADRDAR